MIIASEKGTRYGHGTEYPVNEMGLTFSTASISREWSNRKFDLLYQVRTRLVDIGSISIVENTLMV